MRWSQDLVERWAFQAQLVAVGLLGLAVLMPFVMLPAIVALAVTAVILGPRSLLILMRRRAAVHPAEDRDGRTPPR